MHYSVIDDYDLNKSYAVQFKSVAQAKKSKFFNRYTPVLRSEKDVEKEFSYEDLIGIHRLLSLPVLVRYRRSHMPGNQNLVDNVWGIIVQKARPYTEKEKAVSDTSSEVPEDSSVTNISEARSSRKGIKRPRLFKSEDVVSVLGETIPVRPGSKKYKIWTYMRDGITVAEFVSSIKEAKLPGSAKDLQLAVAKEYIKVTAAA